MITGKGSSFSNSKESSDSEDENRSSKHSKNYENKLTHNKRQTIETCEPVVRINI